MLSGHESGHYVRIGDVMSDLDDIQKLNDRIKEKEIVPLHIEIEADWEPQERPTATKDKTDTDISGDLKMWAVAGDCYTGCEYSTKELPPGQYTVRTSQERGIFFMKHNVSYDSLINLPDSASQSVINEVQQFWGLEDHFRKLGFLWKRGMLLWGPPGSGKTCTVQLLVQDIIKKGGIAIYVVDPCITNAGLQVFRKIESDRNAVVVLEDIDAMTKEYQTELLSMLDGENQIDNVVYLATTNYPERLDKRFINRPSRFDIIKLIDMPSPTARKVYLQTKNPRLIKSQDELSKWVEATEGFSLAHLKELIVSVEVFQRDFEEVRLRLEKMMDCAVNSSDVGRETFGFVVGSAGVQRSAALPS